jgi:hypothetical protein
MQLRHDEPAPAAPPASGSPTPPVSTRGIALGVALIALALVAMGLWADRQGRSIAAAERHPPAIELLAPAEGAVLRGVVELRFASPADLRRGPGGWVSGPFHLHAAVDGQEIMPGAADLARTGEGEYRWTLGTLPAGMREIRLFWSDRYHREVEGSGTAPVRVEIR